MYQYTANERTASLIRVVNKESTSFAQKWGPLCIHILNHFIPYREEKNTLVDWNCWEEFICMLCFCSSEQGWQMPFSMKYFMEIDRNIHYHHFEWRGIKFQTKLFFNFFVKRKCDCFTNITIIRSLRGIIFIKNTYILTKCYLYQ